MGLLNPEQPQDSAQCRQTISHASVTEPMIERDQPIETSFAIGPEAAHFGISNVTDSHCLVVATGDSAGYVGR